MTKAPTMKEAISKNTSCEQLGRWTTSWPWIGFGKK